jgi:hypothetical protein
MALLSPGQVKALSFDQRLYENIKWSFSPAIVCIFIIDHLDRQIDPLLPNIGSSGRRRLSLRIMSCFFFGCLVAGVSVLQTLSITVSRSSWPVGKLHIVVLGTIFTVGLIMALVGEFLLAPTPAAPRTAAPDPVRDDALTFRIRREWAVTGLLAAVLLAAIVILMYYWPTANRVPEWASVEPTYLGQQIPLAWTYQPGTTPVYFEIQSGAAGTVEGLRLSTLPTITVPKLLHVCMAALPHASLHALKQDDGEDDREDESHNFHGHLPCCDAEKMI